MFISDLDQIPALAQRSNFVIFVLDPAEALKMLRAAFGAQLTVLSPDSKTGKIGIDAVREFMATTNKRETKQRFFCLAYAETLSLAAENAILKTLEEPHPQHFFLFLTQTPSALLLTILSRAQLYYLRQTAILDRPPKGDAKLMADAKRLISADTTALIKLANEFASKKDNARAYTLQVCATAIEILYKSYFLTQQTKFLILLPKLLRTYERLQQNGHIKLQIVASML